MYEQCESMQSKAWPSPTHPTIQEAAGFKHAAISFNKTSIYTYVQAGSLEQYIQINRLVASTSTHSQHVEGPISRDLKIVFTATMTTFRETHQSWATS